MEIHRIIGLGGSYAVTLPKKHLQELGVLVGDYVCIALKKNYLEIAPLKQHLKNEKERKERNNISLN